MIAPSPRLPSRLTPHAIPRPVWARNRWLLLLPLPTVAIACWVIVVWQFNGLYGQDPFAYYDFGVGPLRRSLLDGARSFAHSTCWCRNPS